MNKKHFYTAVILLSLLVAGIQPAIAINIPGDDLYYDIVDGEYVLKQNVDETINIVSDAITLDGGGWTVTPTSSVEGVDIFEKSHVTVKNLNVSGGSAGISLRFCDNCTVSNNTVTSCAYGIWLAGTNDTLVTGNTADQCLEAGIWLQQNAGDNNIIGNTANNSVNGAGIYAQNCTNNNDLTGNTVTNNAYGIRLINCSNFNLSITGNNVSYSTEYAIHLSGSSNNIFRNNTISSNYRGLRILNNSDNNQIYNNNFIDRGIGLHASVTNSTGNVFNLPLPIRGNYWDDWSGSGSYGPGLLGGEDNSPWLEPDGWVPPDTTPPEITCPGDTTIQAMAPDGVPIDDERIQTFLAGASATDNCDPPEDIIITNDAPALFPPGDTTVTFTATDTSENSSTCQSTVTIVEAAESSLRIIPSIINREGILQNILAVVRFPEGTIQEDIDIDLPLILYPGDSLDSIEATNQRIVTWYRCGILRVSVFACFSKDEVTAGVPENGPAELMVIGRFTDGQYFYGFDNVWICSWSW